MCALTSKSFDWDLRNIAKISPKITKKRPFSDFFDFLKNCPYDYILNVFLNILSVSDSFAAHAALVIFLVMMF